MFVPRSPIDNDNDNDNGLDNGLALNKGQSIIWTIADPVHWRIYLGGNELNVIHIISEHMMNTYLTGNWIHFAYIHLLTW